MKSFESIQQESLMPSDRGGGSNLEGLSEQQTTWYAHMIRGVSGLAPNLDEFEGIYSREEIERDKARVERRKRDFAHESDSNNEMRDFRAKLAELIFTRLGGIWLDGKVSLVSEFDDYANGVDVVFEMVDEDGESHRLAIDITTGVDEAMRKLRDIGLKIQEGKFSEVKYFKSQTEEGFKGGIEVPRVVVGVSNIDVLAKKYFTFKTSSDPVVKSNTAKILNTPQQALDFVAQVSGELERTKDKLISISAEQEKIDKVERLLTHFVKRQKKLRDLVVKLTKADDPEPQSSMSSVISTWRP